MVCNAHGIKKKRLKNYLTGKDTNCPYEGFVLWLKQVLHYKKESVRFWPLMERWLYTVTKPDHLLHSTQLLILPLLTGGFCKKEYYTYNKRGKAFKASSGNLSLQLPSNVTLVSLQHPVHPPFSCLSHQCSAQSFATCLLPRCVITCCYYYCSSYTNSTAFTCGCWLLVSLGVTFLSSLLSHLCWAWCTLVWSDKVITWMLNTDAVHSLCSQNNPFHMSWLIYLPLKHIYIYIYIVNGPWLKIIFSSSTTFYILNTLLITHRHFYKYFSLALLVPGENFWHHGLWIIPSNEGGGTVSGKTHCSLNF